MTHLSIDIETYSSVSIYDSGAYKYARSKDFEIMLFAYSIDFSEVTVIDLAQGQVIPDSVVAALSDPDVIKHAYNAAFEWFCLNQAGYKTPIDQWRCTMFHAMYLGYPAGLAATGRALGLPEDVQKDRQGKALIRYFCQPCKPTKANGGRTRNLPHHDPAKWELFIEYNRQDVVAESAIYDTLKNFAVPDREQRLWELDCLTNALGVRVDMQLVNGVRGITCRHMDALMAEAMRITHLANPNSAAQLTAWLREQGADVTDIQKDTVAALLESGKINDKVRRMLEIRQELGKSSVKKYDTMVDVADDRERMSGLMQVYGAGRTGRYAGRLVQPQNMPRNYLKTLDLARGWAIDGNAKALQLIYGDVMDTLSQLSRTAFIPSEGRKFVIADFSAIEARVIAWLAREQWVMDVFATHGKIYEATASQMFGVPLELITKGRPEYALRQKGKVATLALGYQGGTGSLISMGALDMGLSEEELPEIVSKWRAANPHIVQLWYRVEREALAAMRDGKVHEVDRGVTIALKSDLSKGLNFLTIGLPSGRSLYYVDPFLKMGKFDKVQINFMAQRKDQWTSDSTYGGKLVENIVQAIARDCLTETLLRVNSRYPNSPVVMHIHDEVVMDAEMDVTVDEICDLMAEPIPWAPGLVLKAAGFESQWYMKD